MVAQQCEERVSGCDVLSQVLASGQLDQPQITQKAANYRVLWTAYPLPKASDTRMEVLP